MKYDAIVLGAGMVGVSTALALQFSGRKTALVDRREPGQEASFGNAGIIQAEAVTPYGFPARPSDAWKNRHWQIWRGPLEPSQRNRFGTSPRGLLVEFSTSYTHPNFRALRPDDPESD